MFYVFIAFRLTHLSLCSSVLLTCRIKRLLDLTSHPRRYFVDTDTVCHISTNAQKRRSVNLRTDGLEGCARPPVG